MISPLFTTIVVGALFIFFFMRYTAKKSELNTKEYLEREHEANSVRKKSLSELKPITVPFDSFPSRIGEENGKILDLSNKLQNISNTKIVNFSGFTNTDLKMAYGAANLPILMEMDQNFTTLTSILYELAQAYVDDHSPEMAIPYLEYGVKIGTDISGHYMLLANLYCARGAVDNIPALISAVDKTHSLTKNATISKLNELIEGKIVNKPSESVNQSSSDDNILPADILDILDSEQGNDPYQAQ